MYPQHVISDVLNVYDQVGTGTIKGTIAKLGYPLRNTLKGWIRNRKSNIISRQHKHSPGGTQHRHAHGLLIDLVISRVEAGEQVKHLAAEFDVSLNTVYAWLKCHKKPLGLQTMSDKCTRLLSTQLPDNPTEQDYQEYIKRLEAQIADMQLDIDIAREIQIK